MVNSVAVSIRAATESQIDDIADLLLASYDEFAPAPGDPLEESWAEYRLEIADVRSRFQIGEHLVIDEGGKMIATATFFPDGSHPHLGADAWPAGYSSMRLLAVHPSQRGRGLGRILTQACIDRASAHGSDYLGLHTTRLMTVAQDMYQRMGFTRFEANDIPVAPDFVVVAYRLPITKKVR